jgi:4-diphosphocytidyl-2-C-methyl-D-erythritol kinase
MVVFPPCKINLGLHILDKRSDGYHNLETIFYPVPLYDVLEIIQQPDYHSKANHFTQTGQTLNVAPGENICEKAWKLLKVDFPELPFVQMHLHKTIPSGAGLGGGSADGAFTLLLLNQKFQLGLTESQLIDYALKLGSDCPFFIINKPCFAEGRGEKMEAIDLSLKDYSLMLVNPQIHVATGWAFSQLLPSRRKLELKKNIQLPVEAWHNQVVNDFEEPISRQHPTIAGIKKKLLANGAAYAAMSGSGSTVFGLFTGREVPTISFPEQYFIKTVQLI